MLNFQWYTLVYHSFTGQVNMDNLKVHALRACCRILVMRIYWRRRILKRLDRVQDVKVGSGCGLSTAITKTTVLLTNEQKEDLHKKSPELFSEIHLDLKMALKSNVTANYVQCKKCGYQHECKLRTDAHVPDDFRRSDSGYM